ncbi:hypothetical protein WR25_02593 isoform C [Diploscapter pachys]|nr:hypothetical protein WR25_02593 isoform C [Diploscapter pachys]
MKELLKPPRTGGPPINGRLRSAVDAADEAKKAGDNEKAARIIVEEGRRCVADNAKALSAEAGGRRRVRSFHGTYLRGTPDDRADFVPVPREWECWYIEDWKGKVALKAIHSPGRFLRAYGNGHVGVAPHHPNDCEEELWTPLQNDDESWSFLNIHGKWLSANRDGSITTVEKCQEWECFRLETW